MPDHEIRDEAPRRRDLFEKWKKIYWDYFIPFAHGMRLFGTVYNDTVHPPDPYEFLTLLSTGNLVSLQRNDILQEMASYVLGNDRLLHDRKEGDYSDSAFRSLPGRIISSHGDLIRRSPHCKEEAPDIINMVTEMASAPGKRRTGNRELQERE